ncbi:MAG: agmatinase [Desulfofustis sp.]|nr:agmatinase [Desulfofustis sp.]
MNNTAIEVYGVPWDEKSSFMQGCRDAPAKIWDAFNCASANRCTESGLSLTKPELLSYRGMLELSSGDQVVQEIERAASDIGAAESLPIFLGGDHAITYPLVKGLRKTYPKLNIIHFDAHPDLYDKIRGDGFSHGCPMARIMEEKLAVRLVSVGIRTMTPHQRSQAEKYGVEIIDMINFDSSSPLNFDGPLYVSLDLDVLDPAFVPGISHHEPGGMSTRELLRAIQNIHGTIIGADIVEYNPHRDLQNMTSMVAAKLMKELAAKMLGRS